MSTETPTAPTVTDRRRWDRGERATYIRVPEKDYHRTIAYAIQVHDPADTNPGWWQVRTLGGAVATVHSRHPTRVQAEEELDQVTQWAAVTP